jgi:hypothetical protein
MARVFGRFGQRLCHFAPPSCIRQKTTGTIVIPKNALYPRVDGNVCFSKNGKAQALSSLPLRE